MDDYTLALIIIGDLELTIRKLRMENQSLREQLAEATAEPGPTEEAE